MLYFTDRVLLTAFVFLYVLLYRRGAKVNATGSGIETICRTGTTCESDARRAAIRTCGRSARGRLSGMVHIKEVAMRPTCSILEVLIIINTLHGRIQK